MKHFFVEFEQLRGSAEESLALGLVLRGFTMRVTDIFEVETQSASVLVRVRHWWLRAGLAVSKLVARVELVGA